MFSSYKVLISHLTYKLDLSQSCLVGRGKKVTYATLSRGGATC
jgi:hypothetical protein